MTRINDQDEITEIPFDEEMGNSHDPTPILEREVWSSSSSAYSLEAELSQLPLENDIGAHSMARPDLDDFIPRPRDIRRYGFSPPAETVILPPRRRFSSLWNPPVLSSLRRSIGLPSQENPVRAEAYESNQAQQQARAPREPRNYNLPTMSPIESRTFHHPYYTQEEPTLPPAPPTTPSRHHSRDRYPPPALAGLYPIMSPHAVPSDNYQRGEDNFSNLLPVRVYAPPPHPPPPFTPFHYRQHYSSPPRPCPTLESPSQSRFSVDDDEQRDTIGHFSLIRSRSRNRSICAACDQGGLGSGDLECTCSFSLRVWVRTKIKKLDRKLKNAEGGRYSMRDNKRVSTRETRTNNQKIKEETPQFVPPPPPNTPASDENIDPRDCGPKRASNQKDLEGVSGRKIKRAKVVSERINLQQPMETDPTLRNRDEQIEPSVLMSGQEMQAEEPGKWLGKWKKGVRKVIIVSKASGAHDKK